MKVHAVFFLKVNSIWVRDTSYFCKNCFILKFQKDSCCKVWRVCLLTTSTKNQRKDASGKNSDQNKEPPRVVIEDSQSTSIVPEPSKYVAAIYSGKLYVGQSRKSMKRVKRRTLISLSIRVIYKDEVNSTSLKKKTKYGFLFLIAFVLFQSLQLLKGLGLLRN